MAVHAFPSFLTGVYVPDALDRVRSTIAVIDTRTEILWVNAAWQSLAHDRGARIPPTYLDGISGALRTYFDEVFARAIATGEIHEQDYECSSPDEIRTFHMRVLPFTPHGLVVEHTQVVAVPAPVGEPPDEARFLDANGQIIQCSNCRRVREPGRDDCERWAWIPGWVARSHPRTSHGICTPCLGFYWRRARRR